MPERGLSSLARRGQCSLINNTEVETEKYAKFSECCFRIKSYLNLFRKKDLQTLYIQLHIMLPNVI